MTTHDRQGTRGKVPKIYTNTAPEYWQTLQQNWQSDNAKE